MESIPAQYWMVVIGAVTALICLILYYIAMFMKESSRTVVEVRETIRESRVLIRNSNRIVEEAGSIVSTARQSVNMLQGSLNEVNESLLSPVKKLGGVMSAAVEFLAELVTPRVR